MSQTRTDIHSPLNMDPADYSFITCLDNQQPLLTEAMIEHVRRLRTKVAETDRLDRGTYQCHHCGAHLRYCAIMLHKPTGEFIAIGEQCLDNRFELESKAEFDRLRKAAELDRAKQRIKTEAKAWLANQDEATARLFDRDVDLAEFGLNAYGEAKIADMRHKLWDLYGNLFEGSVKFGHKLVREAAERKVQEAEAETEVKIPAPTGRLEVTGTVVSRKLHENDFASSWKLTLKVETEDGIWLLWVTEPRAIQAERGDLVRLTATVTPSDRDPSFAFGKRPTKAEILKEANA